MPPEALHAPPASAPAVQPLPAYFKPSQSAALFGWSDEFTYQRLAAGDFRAFKAERATMVETASVLEYLRQRPLKLSRKPRAVRSQAAA